MKRLAILFIMLPVLLIGCADKQLTRASFMMDTVITYNITHESPYILIDACDRITQAHEETLSAYRDDSAVSMFNRTGELLTASLPELTEIIDVAIAVNKSTNGAYDITVAPLTKLWDISHSDEGWTPPSENNILSLLAHVGSDKLIFDNNSLTRADDMTEIDLGGIAKGYTLGKCAEYLSSQNAVGTVSFGGNIALIGSKSDASEWKVGIKNPFAPNTLIGTLTLDSGIVAVSGGYERYAEYCGVRYHHIIDPETGYPSNSDLASVAIWVPDADSYHGAYADALSTALFVMGHDAALEFYQIYGDFEAVLIKTDGSVTVTDGLSERYATNE